MGAKVGSLVLLLVASHPFRSVVSTYTIGLSIRAGYSMIMLNVIYFYKKK
jgi:hypothetical protein